MNDPAIRRVLAAFLLVAVIVLVVATVAVRNINRNESSSDWVNHTHAVILEAQDILSTMTVGEAALRAFAVTGDQQDRRAARDAFAELTEHIEIAKALTRADPVQHEQILAVEALASRRAAWADALLVARQPDRPGSARAGIEDDDGSAATAEVGRIIRKLSDEQMALLAQRDTASFVQAHTTRWTVWTGVALNLILLAGAAWLVRDDIDARRRLTVVLQEANEQLEGKVRTRTAELAAANEHLSAENLERRWANEALEHQIHYNNVIVNSIKDAVFVLTKALNISRINPAVVHLTGFEAHQLVNRPLNTIVHLAHSPGDQPLLLDPVMQALKEGRDLRDLPAEVEDKLGRKSVVLFTLFPLFDRSKVVGGVVILRETLPSVRLLP